MRYLIVLLLLLSSTAHARSVFVDVSDPEVDRHVEFELRRTGYEVVSEARNAEVTITGSSAHATVELYARQRGAVLVHDREDARAPARARSIALASACRKLVPRFVATLTERLDLAAVPPGTDYQPPSNPPFEWKLGVALNKHGKVVTWDKVEAAQVKLRCQLSQQLPCEPAMPADDRGGPGSPD